MLDGSVQLNSIWELRVELNENVSSRITVADASGAIIWSLYVYSDTTGETNCDSNTREIGSLPPIKNVPMTRMLWTNVRQAPGCFTVVLKYGKLRVLVRDKVVCRVNIKH